MSDQEKVPVPAAELVEVELVGGPRDGERRTLRADRLFDPIVMHALPSGLFVDSEEWSTDLSTERHIYRVRMTEGEVGAAQLGVGVRFTYERQGKAREPVS